MKKLTEEQENLIVDLYNQENSLGKIAAMTGHGVNTISKVLDKHGVNRSKRLFSDDIEIKISERYKNNENVSLAELAEEYNTTIRTISNILKRNGVPRRGRGNVFRNMTEEEKQKVIALWRSGESRDAIRQRLGVSHSALNRWIVQLGEVPEKRGASGKRHGAWKGGIIETPQGYFMCWLPRDHKFYSMTNSAGYVYEHRLQVAEWLDRPLLSTEVVHHRNGDRKDNSLQNLQLLVGNHSRGQSYCCAECGSLKLKPIDIEK
jgi:transposase